MASLAKHLMGLDIHERHRIVSRILNQSGSKSVVDVGGTAGLLQMFSRQFEVTTVNVDDSGDVRYVGKVLPYTDNSLDAAVSLDVLEHIPPQDRKSFIEEMLRVARREIVFCTPLGSELHRNIEIELNDAWRKEFGEDHRFLKEHIDNGLPTLAEIKAILADRDYELLFVGDVRLAARLFRNHIKTLKGGSPLIRRFHLLVGMFSSLLFYCLKIGKEADEFTNRVYVHVTNVSQ